VKFTQKRGAPSPEKLVNIKANVTPETRYEEETQAFRQPII
jgi:hypothetical protein